MAKRNVLHRVESLWFKFTASISFFQFTLLCHNHRVKNIRIQTFFSGPYIPISRLNTGICRVNLRIQLKYRKIRTRKNTVFEYFQAVVVLQS